MFCRRNSLRPLSRAVLSTLLISGFFGLFAGCADTTPPLAGGSGCGTNEAQIEVGEGYLRALCGCQGQTAPVFTAAGTPLNCTVNSQTLVLFEYLSTQTQHQIATTDPTLIPLFPTSPISDPHGAVWIRVHSVRFTTPGTYPFQDEFNRAVSGVLTVL